MIEILCYRREDGREPFTEWLDALRDKVAQARIRLRLRHIQAGNFGDCEPAGEGVSELRVQYRRGLSRLLRSSRQAGCDSACGGDKGSQATDIKRAKDLWAEWKMRQT